MAGEGGDEHHGRLHDSIGVCGDLLGFGDRPGRRPTYRDLQSCFRVNVPGRDDERELLGYGLEGRRGNSTFSVTVNKHCPP